MSFRGLSVIFLISVPLMLGAVYVDETLLAGISWVFTLSGMAVATVLASRLYIYSGVLLFAHVGMSAFTTWVFINRDFVVRESTFAFSTFTYVNLQMAIVTLVAASLVVFLVYLAIARGRNSMTHKTPHGLAQEILGRLDRVPQAVSQIALFVSLFLAVLLFLTNTSVLEVSYPYQGATHWAPGELIKAATLLATAALATAYAKRLKHRRGFTNWLLGARVNFLVVSILMLLITGSRGMFTFLWLGFGVLELLLWRNRRGSLGWSLLFMTLAWLSFVSWPYMRWNLALLPTGEVLKGALQIGFGLGSNEQLSTIADLEIIWLGQIPMIGMSLFHLLYTIELIRDGISLGGSTFINLIPQALPSWLDGVLWERPLNDNWILGEYYPHPGGFLLVANAYWNGGVGVVIAFIGVISALFTVFDRYLLRENTGLLYRLIYWLWLPVMIIQLGYGIQGFARVVELLLATMFLDRFLSHRKGQRGRPRDYFRHGLSLPETRGT